MKEEEYYTPRNCRNGWPKIEMELMVLGALRVLASGCSFDLIEELSNADEVTHHNFFYHRFCQWGRTC